MGVYIKAEKGKHLDSEDEKDILINVKRGVDYGYFRAIFLVLIEGGWDFTVESNKEV